MEMTPEKLLEQALKRLEQLEDQLSKTTSMVQCQQSYIHGIKQAIRVNTELLESKGAREDEGMDYD